MAVGKLPRHSKFLPRSLMSWVNFRRKNRTVYIAFVICVYFLYSSLKSATSPTPILRSYLNTPQCPQSPIAEEVLVVLRTGATEALEKLPVHFDTTLRCIPNYAIYSDYEENIEGYHIHDVFDEISEDLKDSVPDFELYRGLKSTGRHGLSSTRHSGSGPEGSLGNPGWKLDKFKFLPMVDKALRHSPNAKWFVFIELDTFLMWGNLLEYLSRFDAQKPYYIGKQMFIGDVLFAHGGSGFVLSVAAMNKVTEHWRIHMAEYDQYTIEQWAGDMVLGKVLRDVKVELLWAFPHFQGDPVSTLDHNITKIDRQPWCYPSITYHHMSGDEIRSLWEFEQGRQLTSNIPVRHADVFKEYVLHSLRKKREEWDNYSVNPEYSVKALKDAAKDIASLPRSDQGAHGSFEACRSACESKADCLQYSYSAARCSISNEVRLGRRATSQCLEYSGAASKCIKTNDLEQGFRNIGVVSSGWMVERLAKYVNVMDQSCDTTDGSWIT